MLNKELLAKMVNSKRGHRLFKLAKKAEELRRDRDRIEDRMAALWNAAIRKAINDNVGMPLGSRTLPGFGTVSNIALSGSEHAIVADAFEIVAQNNSIITAADLHGRIVKAENEMLARIARSRLCLEIGDEPLHRADIEKLSRALMEYVEEMRRHALVLTPERFSEHMNATSRMLACIVELRCRFLHASILARALEIELACLDELVGKLELRGIDKAADGPEAAMIVRGLRSKEERVLAELLLETFYPNDIHERLRALFPEERAGGIQEPKRVDLLREHVCAIIDASDGELNEYRSEFGGDAEKIAKAISISRAGASKKLAVFAVLNSIDDKTIAFMIDAEELIGGSDCTAILVALKSLSAENMETLLGRREALERAAGWIALMPNYLRERPALGFLLGLHFEVPEDKASAYSFLTRHQAELDEALLRNDSDLEQIESDYVAFKAYLKGFVKAGKNSEKPAAKEAPAAAMQAKPYESLVFSQETEDAMRAEGTDPLDVKITLVCGLRLNSAKGARGKTYFNSAVFRRNIYRDLKEERKKLGENGGRKIAIEERGEAAERFLTRHGVLSFYKSRGEVVRLNLGECGTHSDQLGDAIIADTIKWMREFQKKTAI